MMDFVKKGLAFGLGLAVISKEQVEKLVNEMVKKRGIIQGRVEGYDPSTDSTRRRRKRWIKTFGA